MYHGKAHTTFNVIESSRVKIVDRPVDGSTALATIRYHSERGTVSAMCDGLFDEGTLLKGRPERLSVSSKRYNSYTKYVEEAGSVRLTVTCSGRLIGA